MFIYWASLKPIGFRMDMGLLLICEFTLHEFYDQKNRSFNTSTVRTNLQTETEIRAVE